MRRERLGRGGEVTSPSICPICSHELSLRPGQAFCTWCGARVRGLEGAGPRTDQEHAHGSGGLPAPGQAATAAGKRLTHSDQSETARSPEAAAVPARLEKAGARPAGLGMRGYAAVGAALFGLLGVLIVVVANLSSGGDPTRPPANRQGETDGLEAYEISWTEQTSRREYVEDPYACEGVLYCENPFPSGHWETVPGPERTVTDFVCASDLEEARMLVSADVRLTGRLLDADLCVFPDD